MGQQVSSYARSFTAPSSTTATPAPVLLLPAPVKMPAHVVGLDALKEFYTDQLILPYRQFIYSKTQQNRSDGFSAYRSMVMCVVGVQGVGKRLLFDEICKEEQIQTLTLDTPKKLMRLDFEKASLYSYFDYDHPFLADPNAQLVVNISVSDCIPDASSTRIGDVTYDRASLIAKLVMLVQAVRRMQPIATRIFKLVLHFDNLTVLQSSRLLDILPMDVFCYARVPHYAARRQFIDQQLADFFKSEPVAAFGAATEEKMLDLSDLTVAITNASAWLTPSEIGEFMARVFYTAVLNLIKSRKQTMTATELKVALEETAIEFLEATRDTVLLNSPGNAVPSHPVHGERPFALKGVLADRRSSAFENMFNLNAVDVEDEAWYIRGVRRRTANKRVRSLGESDLTLPEPSQPKQARTGGGDDDHKSTSSPPQMKEIDMEDFKAFLDE